MNNKIMDNIINAFVKAVSDEVLKKIEMGIELKINKMIDDKFNDDEIKGFIVDEVSLQLADFDTTDIVDEVRSSLDIESQVVEYARNLSFTVTVE